jgi:hypothetical protein
MTASYWVREAVARCLLVTVAKSERRGGRVSWEMENIIDGSCRTTGV